MVRPGEAATFPTYAPPIIFTNTTDDAGYGLQFQSPTQMRFVRWSATGTSAQTWGGSYDSLPAMANDTWYWTRIRRETTGVFKAKVWTGLVGDEPADWQLTTSSANTVITSGNLGIRGYDYTQERDHDIVSFGIDGTAPSA